VVARERLATRSAAWNLYRFVRSLVPGEVGDAAEPPDWHTSIELCRLCLEHLMRFRCDAKVLADRIGVTPGQLWEDGVRAGVTMINDTGMLIGLGGGAMLAARRLDPARHPAKVRLSIEPTGLPLGRPPVGAAARTERRARTPLGISARPTPNGISLCVQQSARLHCPPRCHPPQRRTR
jgi:hypothetical protein